MALTSLKSSSGRKDKPKSSKRKLEKKVQFYAKVKDVTTSLGAKKTIKKKKRVRSRQKKLKAYDLSALSEFLPDLNAPQKTEDATHVKLNCKSRQKLVMRESAQLRAVLKDPAFQMDPVGDIEKYLEETQPPSAIVKQDGKHNQSGKGKRKGKKAKRKGPKGSLSSSQTSMDTE